MKVMVRLNSGEVYCHEELPESDGTWGWDDWLVEVLADAEEWYEDVWIE